MKTIIPPPPLRNKNSLWERYSRGENLKPSYSQKEISSKLIPPPPVPQMPRSIEYGGMDQTDKIFFKIAFIVITILILLYFLLN